MELYSILAAMLYNYLLVALRNLKKQKGYAFINIFGLALGLACSLIIFLWVIDERSIDQFHEKIDRIYQVMELQTYSNGQKLNTPATPGPLSPHLADNFSSIEKSTRVTFGNSPILFTDDNKSYTLQSLQVDSTFFEIFSFEFVEGDPNNPFPALESIILRDEIAQNIFGEGPYVGRRLELLDGTPQIVSAVVRYDRAHSTLSFSMLQPYNNFIRQNSWAQRWDSNGIRTYLLVREGTDVQELEEQIAGVVKQHHEGSVIDLFLHPYKDYYLQNDFRNGRPATGKIVYVRAFTIVAILILFIACINFMNLATAKSARRSREIGVRKAVGARTSAILTQFLFESLLMSAIAMVIAIVACKLALPYLNNFTNKRIVFDLLDLATISKLLLITLITGLVAGSYPALYMATFDTVRILKGVLRSGISATRFRHVLVVIQFALSIILITSTIFVYRQAQHMITKDVGIDKDQIIYFWNPASITLKFDSFRSEILKLPAVENISRTNQNPLSLGSSRGIRLENVTSDDNILSEEIAVDFDVLETLGIDLVAGRDFSRSFSSDSQAVIINQELATLLGEDDLIGKNVLTGLGMSQIIGIMKNFHTQSVRSAISPLFIYISPNSARYSMVRIKTDNIAQTLEDIGKIYLLFEDRIPLNIAHMSSFHENQYQGEKNLSTLTSWFAGFAIVISCLGLLGLASYTAEQRSKEIGIRKVLGATVTQLVNLLTGNFSKLVIIAFLIAFPVTWYIISNWLERFASHVDVDIWTFLMAGFIILTIAWLTVFYQCLRAALVNPVSVLKNE